MASTTTSTLDDLQQALIGQARLILSQGGDLRDFIDRRTVPPGKSSILFPEFGTVTATTIAEGSEFSSSAISTSGVTVTPTSTGVLVNVTDKALKESSAAQLGVDLGTVAAQAIRDKINQDVWALFDGFTTNAAEGNASSDITEAMILSAQAKLQVQKAPRPYFLPMTPFTMEDLLTIYSTNTNLTSEPIRNQVLATGIMPTILGVTPILIDNLAAGTSSGEISAANIFTAIYSRGAIGYSEGWEIRTETQRVAKGISTDIVVSSDYGVDIVKNGWGVELQLDNLDA